MIRPVLHGDVSNTARALLQAPGPSRVRLCVQIFQQAKLARLHVQKHQHLHPAYGNGSLMAAARRYPLADEPTFDNLDYCRCHALVMRWLIMAG